MKPSDFHPHDAYFIPDTRDLLCSNMLIWSYRIFSQAKCIKDIHKYEELVIALEELQKKKEEPSQLLKEKIAAFAFESLLDSIKIAVCFENYFKVMLLANGYVIHKLKGNSIKHLNGKQKITPLHINEVFTNTKFIQINDVQERLTDNTIGLSTLLKPEYCKEYLNITPKLIKYLTGINNNRNNLHLYLSENFEIGREIYNCLLELNKIVQCDIAVKQNLLMDKYSQNKKGQRLPIKCA